MQVLHAGTSPATAGRADRGENKQRGASNFARQLDSRMAEEGGKTRSAGKDKIKLGIISGKNPTVSHLLVENRKYGDECWDIIHCRANQDKPYTRMAPGTEVYFVPETKEITWQGIKEGVKEEVRYRQAGYEHEMHEIEATIKRAASEHDLSRRLIAGVIRAESGFNVSAVSKAGAKGLMQLMPETARELGVDNPFDIRENIEAGVRYLKKMLHIFGGNLEKALAAYNAGPGAVKRFGGEVPYKETRQYVARVLSFLE